MTKDGRLSGGLRALRLEPVQIIDGALLGRRLEDRAVVVLENLKPGGNVARVVLLDFLSYFEIGAKERDAPAATTPEDLC